MATYCYRCLNCGYKLESDDDELVMAKCPSCGASAVKRDYKAEAVGTGTGVRVSRTGTLRQQADLFLPHREDFAGPGDPDGTKGLRDWNDTHQPADGNTNPVRPQ